MKRLITSASLTLAIAATLTACGSDEEVLTIYSGRDEELVGALLEQLEEEVGMPVEVRYGSSSEMAAQLLEEGEATEADLYFGQDAGALGALANADMLEPLPQSTIDRTLEAYRDDAGRWVATSARARVVAYNPELAPEAAEFDSVDDVLDEKYRGQIGVPPTNASFQAFVTAYRVAKGEEEAKRFLTELKALDPVILDNNILTLEAVNNGEVALGLINHYYWYQQAAEVGAENMTAQMRFLGSDDPGALINVAGAGVIATSEQRTAAEKAAAFLVSDTAQRYFTDETAEYSVVEGITSEKFDLEPLDSLQGSTVDLNQLDSLEQTLDLLNEVGLT